MYLSSNRERARLEKERALQLQRELERTAREEAALKVEREKEKLYKEAQEKEKRVGVPVFEELCPTRHFLESLLHAPLLQWSFPSNKD